MKSSAHRRFGARATLSIVACIALASLSACGRTHQPIAVDAATYGASCGQAVGNVTKALKAACDGKTVCDYTVDYRVLGDPAVGCRKDFSVRWTCGSEGARAAGAAAEAGYGSKVRLQC
jgi:hypothetical protein